MIDAFDPVIHAPVRLRVMATLAACSQGALVEFTRLRALLKLTDGNLGAHLSTLEKAGYVSIEKDFVGKSPRTRIAATPEGRYAYSGHIAALRAIVDGAARIESAEGEGGA
jgi:DNA-binding transcriptional ArsR family regulator